MKILVLGGNRFFGKKLVHRLSGRDHQITLLNRGNHQDDFGNRIERIHCDRTDSETLEKKLGKREWDIVYDQICYNAQDAKQANQIFKNRVGHYVFTSSKSVYEPGVDIKEEAFQPREHVFDESKNEISYAEAKRQAESIFFKDQQLPLTAVRFPIVIGADDYTLRFRFHLERLLNQQEIFFPNKRARISFISSDDAAETLDFLGNCPPQGPINASTKSDISVGGFVKKLESITGSALNEAKEANDENHSPYGIEKDWFMNTDKINSLGLEPKPLDHWLENQARELMAQFN